MPDDFDFIIAQSKHCAGDCTWYCSSADSGPEWVLERRDCTLTLATCCCPQPPVPCSLGEQTNTDCGPWQPSCTTTTTTTPSPGTTTTAPTTTTTTTAAPSPPGWCADFPDSLPLPLIIAFFGCGQYGCCGTFQWTITSTGELSVPIDINGSCADQVAAFEGMPSVPQGCVARCLAGSEVEPCSTSFSMCICEFPGLSDLNYVSNIHACGPSDPCPGGESDPPDPPASCVCTWIKVALAPPMSHLGTWVIDFAATDACQVCGDVCDETAQPDDTFGNIGDTYAGACIAEVPPLVARDEDRNSNG
jgi:hypothetical protein